VVGRPVQFVNVPLAGVPRAGVVSVGEVSVLFVNVSVPARVTSVPVVGRTTVPEPAVAFALSVVVPLVDPERINFELLNVFAPVTVWVDASTMSPDPPPPLAYGSALHAVTPSPIFHWSVSVSNPCWPSIRIGLTEVQFAAVSRLR
jgi:hypothetical protein